MNYLKRFTRLLIAMPVFAVAAVLSIQSGIGVSAWDTFALGLTNIVPLSYGTIVVLTGVVVLMIDLVFKEPIGFGTLADIFMIGKIADFILSFNIIPKIESLPIAILCLVASLFIQSFGIYLYIGAGLSAGPRDAMLIALAKKFQHTPIGLIKGIIEGSVFCIGFLLGAPVGIGTIICVFGVGPILELTLKFFHFDIKSVKHENVFETCHHLFRSKAYN